MKMKVIVDSQADFDKWIKEQPALTAKGTEITVSGGAASSYNLPHETDRN